MATIGNLTEYERKREVSAFEDSKCGVKGLVDAGITKVPPIFVYPEDKIDWLSGGSSEFTLPLIDLADVYGNRRGIIIEQVREAGENWGVFMAVNHGIPTSVISDMVEGVRIFHEQDTQVKKEFYSRNYQQKVSFLSNRDLLTNQGILDWWDMVIWSARPTRVDPKDYPEVIRDRMVEYYNKGTEGVMYTLLGLVSEALGFEANHLKEIGCDESMLHTGNYYPQCPEPELTLGVHPHADTGFITIIGQDQVGGLQVLHQNQWVDVNIVPGALVVIIGSSLQAMTKDRFIAARHRVLANAERPRMSMGTTIGTVALKKV